MEKVNCLITLSNNENTTNDYLTVHHDPDKKTIFYEEKDKTGKRKSKFPMPFDLVSPDRFFPGGNIIQIIPMILFGSTGIL